MSHKAFDALVQAETTAHSDLMIYIRALVHENDALSKQNAKLTGDFADSKEATADLVREHDDLGMSNAILRDDIRAMRKEISASHDHAQSLRVQLDEARTRVTELSGTPISARVVKSMDGLDYLLNVASIRVITPGYFEVRLA